MKKPSKSTDVSLNAAPGPRTESDILPESYETVEDVIKATCPQALPNYLAVRHDQLRIAVVEAMGWTMFPASKDSFGVYCEAHTNKEHVTILQSKLPELTHDYLAACRKTLTPEQRVRYVEHLRNIVGPHGRATIWDYIDASEDQQARAFLATWGVPLVTNGTP